MMLGSLVATTIGSDAQLALCHGSGQIAAVFRRSFYVSVGERFACVGGAEIGRAPLNVTLAGAENLDWRHLLTSGQAAGVYRGSLRTAKLPPIDLRAAASWVPPSAPPLCVASARRGLVELDWVLASMPFPDAGLGGYARVGFEPITRIASAAEEAVRILRNWLGLKGECPAEVAGLLGVGPGLTPSGDDFLAGVFGVLHAIQLPHCVHSLWSVVEQHLSLTNAISAAHLRCAAQGRLNEDQHVLLNAVLGGESAAIRRSVQRLSSDHTSAWDGLAGMATALRVLLDRLPVQATERHLPNQRVAILAPN